MPDTRSVQQKLSEDRSSIDWRDRMPEAARAYIEGRRLDEVECIVSDIAGVARASEETGAAASQVLASASELSRQSEHLGTEVQRFLAGVRAA